VYKLKFYVTFTGLAIVICALFFQENKETDSIEADLDNR
jgi:hypothetical protein